MKVKLLILFLIGLTLVALSGCSAAPKQIASSPADTSHTPLFPGDTIIYTADMELVVGDVDMAANNAIAMARNNSGYLVNSQTWYQDGYKYTTLELAVPAVMLDGLRRSLRTLGTLLSERVMADSTSDSSYPTYTHLTLTLRPSTPTLRAIGADSGWSAARTFESALAVVMSIFHVVADVMIWLIVVIGPFALIGLVIWMAVRQLRHAR